MTSRRRRPFLSAALLFWACYGLWLLLVANLAAPELLAGLAAAGLATTAGWLAARGQLRVDVRAGDLAGLWRLPAEAARDSVLVVGAALLHALHLRRLRARFTTLPFDGADTPLARGRRALTTVRTSFAPNTVVLGFDLEAGEMVVHELVPRGRGRPRRPGPGSR